MANLVSADILNHFLSLSLVSLPNHAEDFYSTHFSALNLLLLFSLLLMLLLGRMFLDMHFYGIKYTN